MASPLISPSELAKRLGDSAWVVVDCPLRPDDPDAGHAAIARHIPGARYATWTTISPGFPVRRMADPTLPAQMILRATAGGLGNFQRQQRGRLRRYVRRDRGAALWIAAVGSSQYRVCPRRWPCRMERPGPCRWTARFPVCALCNKCRCRARRMGGHYHQIPSELASGAVLVDARAAQRFHGITEPIDPVAGHLPGAVNWPFSDALQEDGSMRPAAELNASLRHLTDEPGGLIAMCGSGVTACHLLLAVNAAGLGDGRVYIGSWSEWIRDPERPVAIQAPS